MHPPQTDVLRNDCVLEPCAACGEQFRVDEVREDRDAYLAKTALSRPQSRERNGKHHQYKREDWRGDSPLQLRAVAQIARCKQLAARLHLGLASGARRILHRDRKAGLAEFHDSELALSRHALIHLTVVHDEQLVGLARAAL